MVKYNIWVQLSPFQYRLLPDAFRLEITTYFFYLLFLKVNSCAVFCPNFNLLFQLNFTVLTSFYLLNFTVLISNYFL